MQPLTDKTKLECQSCTGDKYFEIVRLDSSIDPTIVAVPARAAIPNTSVTASTMRPGTKYTLTGGFDSFSIIPLRDSDTDSIVVIKMGESELEYKLGSGCLFDTQLPFLKAIKCTTFDQEIEIWVEPAKDVDGNDMTDCNAYIELLITRTTTG